MKSAWRMVGLIFICLFLSFADRGFSAGFIQKIPYPYLLSNQTLIRDTYISDISDDGTTIVGSHFRRYPQFVPDSIPFRWTAAKGFENLTSLPGGNISGGSSSGQASAVSADGSVIVGGLNSPLNANEYDLEAVRWTQAGGVTAFGDFPGGGFRSGSGGVSNDGQVIVGGGLGPENGHESSYYPFRWTAAEGMVQLGTMNGSAASVSGDGSIIVGTTLEGDFPATLRPFRWTQAEGFNLVGTPGTLVRRVSDDGSTIIGKWSPDRVRIFPVAVKWTQSEGTVNLGSLPGPQVYSEALAVSGDGSLIGGESNGYAFLWDSLHGMRRFEDVLPTDYGIPTDGWAFKNLRAISADGKVFAGDGYYNQIQSLWIVVVPEPSAILYAITGLCALVITRRASQRSEKSRAA